MHSTQSETVIMLCYLYLANSHESFGIMPATEVVRHPLEQLHQIRSQLLRLLTIVLSHVMTALCLFHKMPHVSIVQED